MMSVDQDLVCLSDDSEDEQNTGASTDGFHSNEVSMDGSHPAKRISPSTDVIKNLDVATLQIQQVLKAQDSAPEDTDGYAEVSSSPVDRNEIDMRQWTDDEDVDVGKGDSMMSKTASREYEVDADSVRETMDMMVDLVSAVVPNIPVKETIKKSVDLDTSDDIEILDEIEPATVDVSFEVLVAPSVTANAIKKCFVCDSTKLMFKIFRGGQIQYLCSKVCAEVYKISQSCKCVSCKGTLEVDSVSYSPRFGAPHARVCSEKCLINYEKLHEVHPNCCTCYKTVRSKVCYQWQTKNFCNIKCAASNVRQFGELGCSLCKTRIADPLKGKYSVRFGDAVRQFCNGVCLDKFKRRLVTCTFCQKEIIQGRKVVSGFGEGKNYKLKDFCNAECLVNYRELLTVKAIEKEQIDNDNDQDFCDICAVLIVDASKMALKIKLATDTKVVCSTSCMAAFRAKYKISNNVCDYCHKCEVTTKQHLIFTGGEFKLFCNRRCLNLYVLTARGIKPCFRCKVKKYNFDLVEEIDRETEKLRYACSIQCLSFLIQEPTQIPRPPLDAIQKQTPTDFSASRALKDCTLCREKKELKFILKDAQGANVQEFCSTECVSAFKMFQNSNLSSLLKQNSLSATPAAASPPASGTSTWTPNFSASTPKTSNIPTVSMNGLLQTVNGRPNSTSALTNIGLANSIKTYQTKSAVVSQGAASPNSAGSILQPKTTFANQVNAQTSPVKELIVKKVAPKSRICVATQHRASRVSKAVMCKPRLIDASSQTE